MKRKLLFVTLIIFFLTGCSSYTELNDLSIVNTLGIDYQDDYYYLTMNVINGKLDDNTIEKTLITYTSQKDSLEEAFHDIYLKSSKRLYLSHIDLLVLTEDAINNHFLEIIHNFLENNEYRNNFNVVLLKDISLEEFMQEKILAEDINSLLKTNSQETGIATTKDFETIMKELLIDQNTYLPTITCQEHELVLRGFTLIQDYQIYEELTLKESILLNLLSNKIHKTYLNGSNIFENQTSIKTKQNQITIQLFTVVNKKEQFEQETKQDIENFLKKYQKQGYDILKLSEKIRKNDYSYYQKTDDLLSQLIFNISFEITEKENYLQGDSFYETR